MGVTTVTGRVRADQLGIVLPHEHVYIDLRMLVPVPSLTSGKAMLHERVAMEHLGFLARNPYALLDNAVLDCEEVMEQELLEWKRAGGKTIVDLTLREIGRDPVLLARIARALDLYLIAGCGYYIQATHPPDMDTKQVEHIATEMMQDIVVGMDGTSIRAGVIGEIGTSAVIHPHERNALIAAAMVQQETGLGIHVHTDLWARQGLEVIDILTAHGASPAKICINHVDAELDPGYILSMLDKGVYVEFDNFGKEFYADRRHRSVLKGRFARDSDRVEVIRQCIRNGYESRLLVSNDVCLKTCLHRYGGWGYDHMLTNIVPMMEDAGITTSQVESLFVRNPATFLDDGKE